MDYTKTRPFRQATLDIGTTVPDDVTIAGKNIQAGVLYRTAIYLQLRSQIIYR